MNGLMAGPRMAFATTPSAAHGSGGLPRPRLSAVSHAWLPPFKSHPCTSRFQRSAESAHAAAGCSTPREPGCSIAPGPRHSTCVSLH
jgi:hypothetical protein